MVIGRNVIAFLIAAFLANAAHAVIEITITRSTEASQLIAIVPLGCARGSARRARRSRRTRRGA